HGRDRARHRGVGDARPLRLSAGGRPQGRPRLPPALRLGRRARVDFEPSRSTCRQSRSRSGPFRPTGSRRTRRFSMRFMILVRATRDMEVGTPAPESLFAQMAAYHEALAKAGVLLDAAGLQPSAKGWRVRYA